MNLDLALTQKPRVVLPKKVTLEPPPLPKSITRPRVSAVRLRTLMDAVGVDTGPLTALAGHMGDPHYISEGVIEFVPRALNKSYLSNMLAGRENPPLWRWAQFVILCEWTGLTREVDAEQLPDREAALVRKRLKTAAEIVVWFWSQGELSEWMRFMRRVVLQWLERDKDGSERQRKFYDLYRELCEASDQKSR